MSNEKEQAEAKSSDPTNENGAEGTGEAVKSEPETAGQTKSE